MIAPLTLSQAPKSAAPVGGSMKYLQKPLSSLKARPQCHDDRGNNQRFACRLKKAWAIAATSARAFCHNGSASCAGNDRTHQTKRRHAALASRFKTVGHLPLAFSRCPLYPRKRTFDGATGISAVPKADMNSPVVTLPSVCPPQYGLLLSAPSWPRRSRVQDGRYPRTTLHP